MHKGDSMKKLEDMIGEELLEGLLAADAGQKPFIGMYSELRAELLRRLSGGWVRCTDRLPDLRPEYPSSERVEIWFPNHKRHKNADYRIRIGRRTETDRDHYWDCEGAVFDIKDATYWRLPSPPEGEQCSPSQTKTGIIS